jgi:hypothetical protein
MLSNALGFCAPRIIKNMKRLFILIMVVLLPLRGWAGDLMSVQMAMGAVAPHVASVMPADCPMHTQVAADASSPSGMDGCVCCDLCIPMAGLTCARLEVVAFAAHAAPTTADVDFVSASPTPTLRPPIS